MTKVDKCQTEKDIAKFYFFFITVIGIIFETILIKAVIDVDKSVGKSTDIRIICMFVVPFVLIDLILFMMWYPYERRRKYAIKYGEKYDGKIIKINHRKKR